MLKKNRKSYDLEFKIETVKMILQKGYSIAEASRITDIDYSVLRRWRQKYEKIAGNGLHSYRYEDTQLQSFSVLQAELEKVTEERDILLKTLSHFVTNKS